MKRYTITKGSFLDHDEDGKPVTREVGEQIELEDDVAAAHADKLQPVKAEQTSAPEGEA